MSKVLSKKSITRLGLLLLIIAFGIFLYYFNDIDKVQLLKEDGVTYEKAVVK